MPSPTRPSTTTRSKRDHPTKSAILRGSRVKAVVVDAGAPERIAFREVDPPQPAPDEALVEVRAISLNRGEVNRIAAAADGWRPGWDIGGVVREPAATAGPAGGGPGGGVVG